MEKLQWTGQKGYNDAKWEDWKVKGKAAGYTKASGNLSVSWRHTGMYCANGQMVKIFGAGMFHLQMVIKLMNRSYGSLWSGTQCSCHALRLAQWEAFRIGINYEDKQGSAWQGEQRPRNEEKMQEEQGNMWSAEKL
jgi:hypothetical protein